MSARKRNNRVMEFDDVLRRHEMVRRFRGDPLDAHVVDRILEAGRGGPSAGFSQGAEFLVLEGPQQTQRYWDAALSDEERAKAEWTGLLAAPLIIVPMAHEQAYLDRYAEDDKAWAGQDVRLWPVPYWLVDTAFAVSLILLAAVDEGLGANFLSIGDSDSFRQAFAVPGEYFPIGGIPIGHPGPDGPSD